MGPRQSSQRRRFGVEPSKSNFQTILAKPSASSKEDGEQEVKGVNL